MKDQITSKHMNASKTRVNRVVATELSNDKKTCKFTITKTGNVENKDGKLVFMPKQETRTKTRKMLADDEFARKIQKTQIRSAENKEFGFDVIRCAHNDRQSTQAMLFKAMI